MRAVFFGYFQDSEQLVRDKKSEFAERLSFALAERGVFLDIVDSSPVRQMLSLPKGCEHLAFADIRNDKPSFRKVVCLILSLNRRLILAQRLLPDDSGSGCKRFAKGMLQIIRKAANFSALLERKQIKLVLVWNPHLAMHYLIKYLCLSCDISWLALEGGLVPGSVDVDAVGNQPCGLLVRKSKAFKALNVTNDELMRMEDYLQYVRTNRISKKISTAKSGKDVLSMKSRPRIFVAGMDEINTGICLRTSPFSRSWSPVFRNEMHLLEQVTDWAVKNGVEVVYKPHPNMVQCEQVKLADVRTEVSRDIYDLISASDVIVTLASSVGMQAILLGKPLVLAGVNGMIAKGIAYEVHKEADLDRALENAFSYGLTLSMKKNFINFCAKVVRYYSFAYSAQFEEAFGRGVHVVATRISEFLISGKFGFWPKDAISEQDMQ